LSDIQMSNEVITCFNAVECTYKDCVMYSEEIDMCKLEYLKGKPVAKTSTAPKTVTPKTVEPEAQTTLGGSRLISSLKVGDKSTKDAKINVKGTIKYDPEENTTPSGKTVTNLVINDGTGDLKLAFWGKNSAEPLEYAKGDEVFIEGIFVINEPYKDVAQASAGNYYKMCKIN